jgi:hypothetical protein
VTVDELPTRLPALADPARLPGVAGRGIAAVHAHGVTVPDRAAGAAQFRGAGPPDRQGAGAGTPTARR